MQLDFTAEHDQLESIPQQFRPLFAKTEGGKFKLAEQFGGVGEALTGLNKALQAARNEKRVDLSPLSEFGSTPEEIKAKIQDRLKTVETEGGKANSEKIRKELAEHFGKETDALKARNANLQKHLYELMVRNTASTILADPEISGDPELVFPFIAARTKVVEENGVPEVHVVNESGERRYSNVTGAPMTMKDLVVELRNDKRYARLFNAQVNSGGGMKPGTGSNLSRRDPKTMSSIDKISLGLQSGIPREARK